MCKLFPCLFLLSFSSAIAAPGTVFMVIGSDTAVWNAPGGVSVGKYRMHFDPAIFTSPETNAFKAINPAFRARFLDSFGQPLKLTWWLLVGSVYGRSDNTDVPVPNLMPLYLMRKYHGAALTELGDEVTLHYHTFLWSDYNGDGISFWNEARTFHECRDDWDLALAQSLIEEEVFPVSFRSGWHFMDNEWQQYLNRLLPYSMDDDSPNVRSWYTNEPIYNVLDWSKAPVTFVPYQPASTNYQIPGDGPGWNVRSVKFPNVTQTMVNHIFDQAAGGTDQVVSFWGHLPESDFLQNIAKVDAYTQIAASNNPAVHFRYCTAVEAMKRWRRINDDLAPTLNVDQTVTDGRVSLTLRVSEPIFQMQPFVAVKDVFQRYRIVQCDLIDSTTWKAVLPVPASELAKIGIAVTDLAGNLTTRIIRFLPDDLYIDNLDPQYAEAVGDWKTTSNAAWGTDARIAVVNSNQTAQIKWELPVTVSGEYNISVQVPAVTNAARHVTFGLWSGQSNAVAVDFSQALPTNQWVNLFRAFLDATATNRLEMIVAGNQDNDKVAVADVIRVSPLVLPLPGYITDVSVESSDTVANITWTTASFADGFIEFGADAALGYFSRTNSGPAIHHVATLTGLKPGSSYHFRINSSSVNLDYAEQGSFITRTDAPAGPPVLHYSNEGNLVTLYWTGDQYGLQQIDHLDNAGDWNDLVPSPGSPFILATNTPGFYRLITR
jgi:hypothetical protein